MIGDKITEIREKLNLSRKEFASKLDVSQSTIINVETHKFAPGINLLQKISEFTDFPLHKLAQEEFPVKENETIASERDRQIGQKIKYYRTIYDMTQDDLAIALGYQSPSVISMIERGLRGISKEKLLKFCQILDIHISDVIEYNPDRHKEDPLYQDFMYIYNSERKPKAYESIAHLIKLAADELRNGH